MAHFAEIDDNNVVVRVLVVDDLYQEIGHKFLSETCGLGGTWLQTSYNTSGGVHANGGVPLRKNYAGPGMVYDSERDAFIHPKPFASWILNENTCIWEAPIAKPNDGKIYSWDEEASEWVEITLPTE